jgi:hypothetical protein
MFLKISQESKENAEKEEPRTRARKRNFILSSPSYYNLKVEGVKISLLWYSWEINNYLCKKVTVCCD